MQRDRDDGLALLLAGERGDQKRERSQCTGSAKQRHRGAGPNHSDRMGVKRRRLNGYVGEGKECLRCGAYEALQRNVQLAVKSTNHLEREITPPGKYF